MVYFCFEPVYDSLKPVWFTLFVLNLCMVPETCVGFTFCFEPVYGSETCVGFTLLKGGNPLSTFLSQRWSPHTVSFLT